VPENPELRLATIGHDADALADTLIDTLRERGIIG
jgi:hypothetical protein